jgi:hypothetical protein
MKFHESLQLQSANNVKKKAKLELGDFLLRTSAVALR